MMRCENPECPKAGECGGECNKNYFELRVQFVECSADPNKMHVYVTTTSARPDRENMVIEEDFNLGEAFSRMLVTSISDVIDGVQALQAEFIKRISEMN